MKKRTYGKGVIFIPGKRGGSWYVDFIAPDGRRIRQKINASSKTEARDVRSLLMTDAMRDELRLPGRKKTTLLSSLADQYLEHAKLHKRSWRLDVDYLKRIKAHFGDVPVERITREQCEAFKAEVTKALQQRAFRLAADGKLRRGEAPTFHPATVNRYMACLKRMFSWAEELGKIDRNPAAKVKQFRETFQPYHLLTPDEERRLLEATNQGKARHLAPIIKIALLTGMRKEEILGLTWAQVDTSSRLITLTRTKNGQMRHVPLNADALAVLAELKAGAKEGAVYVFTRGNGERMGDVKTAWYRALRVAGISADCRFHDLRHTYISRLVMNGVDLVAVGRMAGWTDSSAATMVRRYTHHTPDYLHKAAATLEAGSAWQNYGKSFPNELKVVENRKAASA